MIDLYKAYDKAKKYVSKADEFNDFGFYYYIELEEIYAFLIGLNRENSLFKKVITVNKTGGKVLECSILKLNKQFKDFNIHNLIEIASYTSQEKREEEINALQNKTGCDVFINTTLINTYYDQSMTVDTAYEWLKTQPIFEDAEDA